MTHCQGVDARNLIFFLLEGSHPDTLEVKDYSNNSPQFWMIKIP